MAAKLNKGDKVRVNDKFPNPQWHGVEGIVVISPGYEIYYFSPEDECKEIKCYDHELDRIEE